MQKVSKIILLICCFIQTPKLSFCQTNYDFSELKSQGCDVIKSEFKQFAIKYISYRNIIKSNPSLLRPREDKDWDNNLRQFSDLATTCAIRLKGDYALEVLGYMENVSALLPMEPVIASSGNSSLIEGSGSTAKTRENSNQPLEYDFSELKSQGCDVIKSEFKQFAIKFISYKKRVKSNPSSLSFREDTDWENNLRKFSDLVTDCAIKLKGVYGLEVMGYMDKVSSLLPIDPIVPSSSRNKSTTSTSQSKSTQASNTAVKKVDQSAGFANAQSSTLIGKCRFTGPQPGKGVSLSIGSDVQLYHNGSFKMTTIGGGVDYYTGNGDVWIIYKNPKARTKYNFKTSNGKVQTCDGY
jgi:hypothetical protein